MQRFARMDYDGATHARGGQTMILVALVAALVAGLVALAIDLGHAYERRQYLQNMATSAAFAGAYEVYGIAHNPSSYSSLSSPQKEALEDALVKARMGDLVTQYGATVKQWVTPPSDACNPRYTTNQVFLQAVYMDINDHTITDSGGQPMYVGNGSYPATSAGASANAAGVHVLSLGSCIPRYFAAVLGNSDFRVAADARSGQPQTPVPGLGNTSTSTTTATATGTSTATATATVTSTGTATSTPTRTSTSTPTGSPTRTPTATATATVDTTTQYGIGDFAVYGFPSSSSSSCPYSYMLFSVGSTCNSAGDTVELANNSGNGWQNYQYATQSQGQSGTPGGISLHDNSIIGCLDPSVTFGNLEEDLTSSFNQGGVGHCASLPPVNSVVTIPVVDAVCKNGNCSNGGYTYYIKAFVRVQITVSNSSNFLLQGVIVSVVYDPYSIVQPPAPATPTPTPTLTATSTPTATATFTPVITNTPTVTATVTPTQTATVGPPTSG